MLRMEEWKSSPANLQLLYVKLLQVAETLLEREQSCHEF